MPIDEIIKLIEMVESGVSLFANMASSVKNVINSGNLPPEDVDTLNARIDAAIAKLPKPDGE
jgi:hypothetical protein